MSDGISATKLAHNPVWLAIFLQLSKAASGNMCKVDSFNVCSLDGVFFAKYCFGGYWNKFNTRV